MRGLTFMVADRILPLQRGARLRPEKAFAKSSSLWQTFGDGNLFLPCSTLLTEIMGKAYPELTNNIDYITRIIKIEEERLQKH